MKPVTTMLQPIMAISSSKLSFKAQMQAMSGGPSLMLLLAQNIADSHRPEHSNSRSSVSIRLMTSSSMGSRSLSYCNHMVFLSCQHSVKTVWVPEKLQSLFSWSAKFSAFVVPQIEQSHPSSHGQKSVHICVSTAYLSSLSTVQTQSSTSSTMRFSKVHLPSKFKSSLQKSLIWSVLTQYI